MERNVSPPWHPEGDRQAARLRRGRDTLMASGTLGIAVALVCCAAPLVLLALGVGAAWVVFFTDLERYLLPILAVTAVCFAGGVWFNRKLAKTTRAVGTDAVAPPTHAIETNRSGQSSPS